MFSAINACVIIPTYNNARTLKRVLDGVLEQAPLDRIIVINDGSTDDTPKILEDYQDRMTILQNAQNSGKGYSLRKGFKEAIRRNFEYAITIDSDGQHFPSDIPTLLKAIQETPDTVLMGTRNMGQEGVPQKSSFGNKFSNFWFLVETGIKLPDTQTGYRVYPLKSMRKMRFFTTKFELEIEVIVRLAWKGVKFRSIPVEVKYDPEERVSHFRPGRDFFRISVLNTVLVLGALLYYYPKRFFSRDTLRVIRHEAVKPEESNLSKSLSLAFGVFMGIIPIWGFQLLIGIPLAVLFRMNKVLFIAAANISIPPMIPFIVYGSLLVGQQFTDGYVNADQIFTFTSDAITENLRQYLIGACILAAMAFVVVFLLSFTLLKLFRKEPVRQEKA